MGTELAWVYSMTAAQAAHTPDSSLPWGCAQWGSYFRRWPSVFQQQRRPAHWYDVRGRMAIEVGLSIYVFCRY